MPKDVAAQKVVDSKSLLPIFFANSNGKALGWPVPRDLFSLDGGAVVRFPASVLAGGGGLDHAGFQALHGVEHIGDVLAEVAQSLQAFGGDGGFKTGEQRHDCSAKASARVRSDIGRRDGRGMCRILSPSDWLKPFHRF